jgi:hypothetical protein
MNTNPNCEDCRELLVLEAYGELSFDQEDAVEAHLSTCAACREERAALARLHAAADDVAVEPSLELLSAAREDLRRELRGIAAATRTMPFWRRWLPQDGFWSLAAKPLLASALFAAGFAGARLVPASGTTSAPASAPASAAASALMTPAVRNVRYIEPSADGQIRIVYDEVWQREMAGRVDDKGIREMLLAATRDPEDPGLRLDSMEVLRRRVEREDVRTALVRALETDGNEGVRLKALEALKPFAGEPPVRTVLTRVLVADKSATVRTQTIDLLVNTRCDEPELAGVLQELMRREENAYIRQRSQSALKAMNASLETF